MSEIAKLDTRKSVVARFADTYGVDRDKLLGTLKATCFKQKDVEISNEQMMALLIVAEQHKLNPFTKEIYAFPDKKNGIVPFDFLHILCMNRMIYNILKTFYRVFEAAAVVSIVYLHDCAKSNVGVRG